MIDVAPTPGVLRALDGDDVDSVETNRALAGQSPFPWLYRACARLERRQLGSGRLDVDRAVTLASAGSPARLLAGALYFLTHDYQRVLDLCEALQAQPSPLATRARNLAWQTASALGWDHDARRWLEASIAHRPRDIVLRSERVRLGLRGDDLESALLHARAAAEIAQTNPTMQMQVATLAAAQREDDAAIRAAELALDLAPTARRALYLRAAADVAIEVGDFARAVPWLHEAAAEEPAETGPRGRLAELAAWEGDVGRARALAEAVLAQSPQDALSLRVLGGLHVCAGELDEAERLLAAAVALDPGDAEAHLWRGEAALRAQRRDDAEEHLHLATSTSPGHRCAAWMVRILLILDEPSILGTDGLVPPARLEEFVDALRELSPVLGPRAIESRTRADTAAALESALRALRGNRSAQPTHVVDGKLVRLRATGGCRYDARRALQLLRVADPAVSLRALDRLVERLPGSSLPVCHRGELRLWLGDLDAAKRDLEAAIAINIGTRWAYMGLSTLALMARDPAEALAINARGVRVMRGTEGPGIHVYRGEAHRLAGRLDDALVELRRATSRHPGRVSATINLALTLGARGETEEERTLFQRLVHQDAPGLLSDAADELALVIVGDGDWVPDRAIRAAVLGRALEMMKGNRSASLITYWRGEHLRIVPPPGRGLAPHWRDAPRIAQARASVLAAWRATAT